MNGLNPHLNFLGSQTLIEKIKTYRPKIAVFNGKGIYEVFSGKKTFPFGKQPDKIDGTETVRLQLFN
jgi:mismatch-specific thymine-DNA glycosylase